VTSLRGKIALVLAAVLFGVLSVFLAVLLPLERQQHDTLVDRYQRLLTTLRERYERDVIYDILGENDDSLALTLSALAHEPEILWAKVEHDGAAMLLTTDDQVVTALVGSDVGPLQGDALAVRGDGTVARISTGGLLTPVPTAPDSVRWPGVEGAQVAGTFSEGRVQGRAVLVHRSPLKAAEQGFGQFEIVGSLADVQRAETLTRQLLFALLGTTFLLLLVVLNALVARIVLHPVRRVVDALAAAREGRLDVRLPEGPRDEIGRIAEAFNTMAAELDASRRAIEAHSRGLEGAVQARTRELSDVKEHLETVIASVGTGVISVDAAGLVATFNERAGVILGLEPRDARHRPFVEVLAAVGATPLVEAAKSALDGPPSARADLRLRLRSRQRALSVGASSLGATGGMVVVIDDLTEILASQRLEAWKQAVEKVIHEIKNPLTPIGLSAQALQTAHASDPARFEEIFPEATDNILRAVHQLKDLISEFTRFSRLPKVVPRPHDLNEVVAETLQAYSAAEQGGVRVRSDLTAPLPPVAIDPEPFKRVLLNLVNNGLEAMQDRTGEVVVGTRFDGQEGFVVLFVSDQGAGIEDVERVFEPYYTTKPKGTGLGLLISRQIVEEHGGQIRIVSEVGRGSTVEVRFPPDGS
jgi:nitrogen fixation/metabolism regulation signal transduction histidine kinase